MLDIQTNELTDNIFVIKVFYFDIINDLIENGFMYNGEHYRYFTSSAGQIRTKKTVFIKTELWNKYEKTLMCGLTVDLINQKGGINENKYMAYLALSNSATDVFNAIDIHKTIVVEDFETIVTGLVDYIDDVTYKIERKEMPITINHTDGCGLILPSVCNKNLMVRLPWIKGLLAVCDFRKFIDNNNGNYIIQDIYGNKHDIIKEDIQIIFTKSQFKMYKYYDDWDDYKTKYTEYNCQAGYCNMEDDYIGNATINYQMLQTLNNMTVSELEKIASKSNDKLLNIVSSVKTMLEVFGVTKFNTNKTHLQQALEIYPEMLTDPYIRDILKKIKKSMVKSYRAGKLNIKGKYTFFIPDLYAVCEYLFLGIKDPQGLLKNGEVSCRLYKGTSKLDCLRSPHLYIEHVIRNNIIDDEVNEWFQTDALYTSCHDLMSKILQFDELKCRTLWKHKDENLVNL